MPVTGVQTCALPIWVIQARSQARLLEKHLSEVLVLGKVTAQQLDGNKLLEPSKSTLSECQEHLGHPAVSDLGDETKFPGQLVRASNLSW